MTEYASDDHNGHPAEALLVLALDDELIRSEQLAVTRHVKVCSECCAKWEELEQISQRMAAYHMEVLQARVPAMSAGAASKLAGIGRKTHRRTRRWVQVAAVIAVAAGVTLLLRVDPPAPAHRELAQSSPAPLPTVTALRTPALPHRVRSPKRARLVAVQEDPMVFVALPFSDRALPLNDATVVRVELPAEQLQLTGLTIVGNHTGSIVQADVLMGIDGLPRAIRLVE